KLPEFGPELFGTTVPSMIARPRSRMAAHTAASSAYAGSRAGSGNGGVQLAGTPIIELLCWIPERFALLAIRTRAWAIPWFSVTFATPWFSVTLVDVALKEAKAASQFGIGTHDAPNSSKPPPSRWLVVVIEELTSAWMPDIVAIVNMTRAMLARVAPVRNFLFIGYAIAVRTTGRHVRPRTSRVATARIESLLNSTISRPPSTSMRPAAMKSVMSAFAMLKNFHGLRTHPPMNAPAAVKTARAGSVRVVSPGRPQADAPKTCEKPQRMTPATSKPVKVPITEDSSAYSRPSETKLWTRLVRRIPRARATPISPFRSSASMTKMLMINRMPAMTVKN